MLLLQQFLWKPFVVQHWKHCFSRRKPEKLENILNLIAALLTMLKMIWIIWQHFKQYCGSVALHRNIWICTYVIFSLRDQWVIERLSKAMGAAFVCNSFSPIPSETSFLILKKHRLVATWNLQSMKAFWLSNLELSQYCKSGTTFSSSKQAAASSDCLQLGNTLCLCLPVWPAQEVLERCPKSSAIDFAVKTFDFLLQEWLPDG